MKSIFTILCLVLFSFTNAQIFNPVSWETNLKEIEESVFELSITAKIESVCPYESNGTSIKILKIKFIVLLIVCNGLVYE